MRTTREAQERVNETLDLLVDYWPIQYASTVQHLKKEEKKEINKVSIPLFHSYY